MITTELEKKSETIPYEENILNFLDYTILLLSQVSSAKDVDIIMDDFLSDDFIDILVENKQLFSILSIIWLNAFKRAFINDEENSFSLKVLWVPVLYHKLGWKIEDQSELSELHTLCLTQANQEKTLYNYLVLIFIEGIYSSLEFAFENFKNNVNQIAKTEEDILAIATLKKDIISLGWPNIIIDQQPINHKPSPNWHFTVSNH